MKQTNLFLSNWLPAEPTEVFETYWKFACERQKVFFKRYTGEYYPWTNDPVINNFKFTNAYRASDRVSQYLIRNVIYSDHDCSAEDTLFRILLFKIFNRINTWEYLQDCLQELSWETFNAERLCSVLDDALAAGERIYSAAYIMPSGGRNSSYKKKHHMHIALLENMMRTGLPKNVANAISMKQVFEYLRSYPTIGNFLAYQYAVDINYSELTDFSENEFVEPGPGALRGIAKCFRSKGGITEVEIIRRVTELQGEEFKRLGLQFQDLWGRPLQLIDCQNLFCEVDKYSRVVHPEYSEGSGCQRIKQKFKGNIEPIHYWYPPKWGINNKINKQPQEQPTI